MRCSSGVSGLPMPGLPGASSSACISQRRTTLSPSFMSRETVAGGWRRRSHSPPWSATRCRKAVVGGTSAISLNLLFTVTHLADCRNSWLVCGNVPSAAVHKRHSEAAIDLLQRLLEMPVPAGWQAIVCRVDACRVLQNFYTWTFGQAIPCKPLLQAASRRKPCPEYPAWSSLFRRFCGIHHVMYSLSIENYE